MQNFLIEVAYDEMSGSYMACYTDGQNIMLGANTYQDAVLETDMISPEEYV
jgi:hypothetical protein